RLCEHHVRNGRGEREVRLVEAALVARDGGEGRGRLARNRRRRLDVLRDQQVRVDERGVEVRVGHRCARGREGGRVLAERLRDQIGVEPPVLRKACLHLDVAEVQGRVHLPAER